MTINNRKLLLPIERIIDLNSVVKTTEVVFATPTKFGLKLLSKGYKFNFGYEKNGLEMALVEHKSIL